MDDRLVFVCIATPPKGVFGFIGNHDKIQKWIRSNPSLRFKKPPHSWRGANET
jgi:hypothetical protein